MSSSVAAMLRLWCCASVEEGSHLLAAAVSSKSQHCLELQRRKQLFVASGGKDSWEVDKRSREGGPSIDKWKHYNQVVWPPGCSHDGQPKAAEVFHCREHIKYSPKAMWYICQLLRHKSVDEAVRQLEFIPRKGALIAREVLLEAQLKAVRSHNFEFKSDMFVAEAFTVQSLILKGVRRHARGRYGLVHYRYCNLFVRLQQGPAPADPRCSRVPIRTGWNAAADYLDFLRSRRVEPGL